MQIFLTLFLLVILLFGFVVAFGAPYLPTLKKQTKQALDLLELQPGQRLLELGCGDGRVARAAAQRGMLVTAYELNPLLVIIAKINTWKYRRQVSVRWGNFWRESWPACDGIFVFLLDKYMKKLDKKIIHQRAHQRRPIRLVSFTFQVPDREPDHQDGGLYAYDYQ